MHKWTSLVCTAFLLLLCVSGLPLIFHDEIDSFLGAEAKPDPSPPGGRPLSLDRILDIARASRPREVITFASPDDDEPVWDIYMAPSLRSPTIAAIVSIDGRTGRILRSGKTTQSAPVAFLADLHENLFMGSRGDYVLSVVALCFIASIVSGVVVYRPFMRRSDFGVVRKDRSRKLYWLDVHNLVGIVLTSWMLVVGGTGLVNTLAAPIAAHWQSTELVDMIAPWKNAPIPARLASVQKAVDVALARAPGMKLSTVAMPGTPLAGGHHYNVFLTGNEPLTSKLIMPVLIDAANDTFSTSRSLPWYVKALFLSKPLHFGDYGGMPLKIIWAALDLLTILVLCSGVYLWITGFARESALFSETSDRASAKATEMKP